MLARRVSQDSVHLKHHLECLQTSSSNVELGEKENMQKRVELLLLKRRNMDEKVKSSSKLHDDLIIKAVQKSARLNNLKDKINRMQDNKRDLAVSKELKECTLECMKVELSRVAKVLARVREQKAIKVLRGFKIVTALIHPSKRSLAAAVPPTVEPPPNVVNAKKGPINLHGCTTIMGLPLPNNGFYNDCPLEILCSVINLAARAVKLTAEALNITLPHPIDINQDVNKHILVLHQQIQYDGDRKPISLLPADLNPLLGKLYGSNSEYIWHSISDIR
jgi:hypothetical protein